MRVEISFSVKSWKCIFLLHNVKILWASITKRGKRNIILPTFNKSTLMQIWDLKCYFHISLIWFRWWMEMAYVCMIPLNRTKLSVNFSFFIFLIICSLWNKWGSNSINESTERVTHTQTSFQTLKKPFHALSRCDVNTRDIQECLSSC